MNILSRKDAIAKGSKLYFTGVICKNGHVSQRYTATCACRDCLNGYQRTTNRKVVLALAGTPLFSMPIHVDDHAAMAAYGVALYLQRGMAPPSTPSLPTPAKPQPTRWELWSRTHAHPAAINLLRSMPPHSPEELLILAGEAPCGHPLLGMPGTLPRPSHTHPGFKHTYIAHTPGAGASAGPPFTFVGLLTVMHKGTLHLDPCGHPLEIIQRIPGYKPLQTKP